MHLCISSAEYKARVYTCDKNEYMRTHILQIIQYAYCIFVGLNLAETEYTIYTGWSKKFRLILKLYIFLNC